MKLSSASVGPGLAGVLVPAIFATPNGAAMGELALPILGQGDAAHVMALTQSANLSGGEYLTEQEALALFFPTATRFERGIALPEGLVEQDLRERDIPRHFFRYAAYQDEELLGFGVVDNVKGKSRPITYLLATDTPDESGSLRVVGVEILVYRESHGSEVDREAFREQFIGKSSDDAIKLKDDIRNVAGATISCRSVTDGVHDMLTLLEAVPVDSQTEVAVGQLKSLVPDLAEHEGAAHFTRTKLLMNAPLRVSIGLDAEGENGLTRERAIEASEKMFGLVSRLEKLHNRFDETSSISKVNTSPGTRVLLDKTSLQLLQRAEYWATQSGGAFDVVVGSLTALWKESPQTPSISATEAARKLGGIGKLTLGLGGDESDTFAMLAGRGAELDLGGCAKGHAIDEAAKLLKSLGVENACIDFGGQLLVIGEPHMVELRDTADAPNLVLGSGSLATTGDAERGLIIDGVPHSHIMDPRTGRPALGLHMVTVFAATALDADILSTLLFVLGLEEGKAFAEAHGIAARFSSTISPRKSATTSAWVERFPGKK